MLGIVGVHDPGYGRRIRCESDRAMMRAIARLPDASTSSMGLPSPSSSTGCTPKNGNVADPGLRSVAPGSVRDHDAAGFGLPPSIYDGGSGLRPTTWWYHSHTSGLMGSPTVPNTLSDARDVEVT